MHSYGDTVEEAVANEKQVHTAKLNEVGHKNEMQVRGLKEALSEANKNIEQLKSMHNDKRRLVEDLQQQLAAAHSGVQAHASELDYHRSSYESAKNALTTELEHHKAGHEHHRSEAARILQAHTKFAREAKLAHEAVVAELEDAQLTEMCTKIFKSLNRRSRTTWQHTLPQRKSTIVW